MAKPTISNFVPYLVFGVSGLLCGIGVSNFVLAHRFELLRVENIAHQNRIKHLSAKLQEQTDFAGALSAPPLEAVAQIDQPAPSTAAVQQQAPTQPPARKKTNPNPIQRAEPTQYDTSENNQQVKAFGSTPARIRPEETQLAAPAPDEDKKIEAVSIKKAGVSKIERGSVTLENGTRIQIGEKFPSGEKLMFVDAANQHIVTDKRQLLLLN